MGYNLTENLFGYTLVQDILVESATTSVTFSGLNYTADDDLLLVSEIINTNVSSGSSYSLFVNSSNTNSSYYYQAINSNSSSITSERGNFASFSWNDIGSRAFSISKIKMTNSGYFVSQSSSTMRQGTSNVFMWDSNATSTFTISSINQLKVESGVANSIGIGSRFRLYKLNATKVADITVGTATTSVDITGLNITKDSEYMLVSDVYNPLVANTAYSLFSNNNTTQTNYYRQYLYADNTTIGSGRLNQAYYMDIDSVKSALCYTNIKLTNSGNIIYQANFNNRYGTSSQFIQMNNMTSTFTSTNITQLTITANTTNGIGVGSRFQLYRMKG